MRNPQPRPPQFKLKVGRTMTGFGLFAKETIPKGRFIAEYHGELVKDEVADQIGGKYLFGLDNGKSILGGGRDNVARYINHGCKPNAEPRQVGNKIFIFSKKRIEPEEEITYNYGKDYFEGVIKPIGCLCKACRRPIRKAKQL